MNNELKKETLDEITRMDFLEALSLAMTSKIDKIALIGFSGEDVCLFGRVTSKQERENGAPSRISLIQFRNYSGNSELLITDKVGNFLFYGKIDDRMGIKNALDFYWETFLRVRPFIEEELPERNRKEDFTAIKGSVED